MDTMMNSDQPGLFAVEDSSKPAPRQLEEIMISDEQIMIIRQAFDNAKISDMSDRQEIIQSCMIRPISNIRKLYAREVAVVLRRIASAASADEPMTGSAWDNREEDTWIDKL